MTIKRGSKWLYHRKSYDSGLVDLTVGNEYEIYVDCFNELVFNDDYGMQVDVEERLDEFLKCFKPI